MLTTGILPLLSRGIYSEDLMMQCSVAIFLEGLPSCRWSSSDTLVSAPGSFHFVLMAIIVSPDVVYWSIPTGWGDFRENPAFRSLDFLRSRTLPHRPSSGWLRFPGTFLVGPGLPQYCLPLSQDLPARSFWFRLQLLFGMAFSGRVDAWFRPE